MSKRKTVSISEEEAQYIDNNSISPSALLQSAIQEHKTDTKTNLEELKEDLDKVLDKEEELEEELGIIKDKKESLQEQIQEIEEQREEEAKEMIEAVAKNISKVSGGESTFTLQDSTFDGFQWQDVVACGRNCVADRSKLYYDPEDLPEYITEEYSDRLHPKEEQKIVEWVKREL